MGGRYGPRCELGLCFVKNAGRERFKIVKVVEERPVLVCEIEYLPTEDESSHSDEVGLREIFRAVLGSKGRTEESRKSRPLARSGEQAVC